MVLRRLRVLLDTSVVIAGILSPEGGAGAILEACRLGLIELHLTPGIISEATEKFLGKFPELAQLFEKTLKELNPKVIADPPPKTIRQAAKIIADPDDAPILAAAQNTPVDYLITLDIKHFLTEKVKDAATFSIVTPGKFLEAFRAY